jgi:hypothetical protein
MPPLPAARATPEGAPAWQPGIKRPGASPPDPAAALTPAATAVTPLEAPCWPCPAAAAAFCCRADPPQLVLLLMLLAAHSAHALWTAATTSRCTLPMADRSTRLTAERWASFNCFAAALLELGPSCGSRKGILRPRGVFRTLWVVVYGNGRGYGGYEGTGNTVTRLSPKFIPLGHSPTPSCSLVPPACAQT